MGPQMKKDPRGVINANEGQRRDGHQDHGGNHNGDDM